MALTGLTGYVTVNGAQITGDKFDTSRKQVVVDRSNFTTEGLPLNGPGQKTGEFVVEGPYEGILGVNEGSLYTFVFGITAVLFLAVQARVSEVNLTQDKNTGPRFRITAEQYGAATVQH